MRLACPVPCSRLHPYLEHYSKSIQMPDIVIGLCVNRYEFGLRV